MSAMRGLGRGFSSLIPTDVASEFDPTKDEDVRESKLVEIDIDKIVPDENQPRRTFGPNALQALGSSIKEHGVLQPIVVTKEGGKYKIVAGERRWRASKLAGLEKIPAIVRTLDSQNRLELSLIENLQREDLNAIEIATAYAKLRDQFNMDSEQISKRVGKNKTTIINTMRLLRLPEDAKRVMVENNLTEGQMRPLTMATEEQIKAVLPRIVAENWNARKVEQYMVELKAKEKAAKEKTEHKVDEAAAVREKKISKHLGITVKVHTSTRGSGNIMLKFKNKEEFEKLCTILTTSN